MLPNGTEYNGTFSKGFLEGSGTLTIKNMIYKGKYVKGIFQGDIVYTNEQNQHFIFQSKHEKNIQYGLIDIYLSNGFVL